MRRRGRDRYRPSQARTAALAEKIKASVFEALASGCPPSEAAKQWFFTIVPAKPVAFWCEVTTPPSFAGGAFRAALECDDAGRLRVAGPAISRETLLEGIPRDGSPRTR